MFEANIAVMLVVCLIGLVAFGVHIAIALGMTSALGIFMVTGADMNAFVTVQKMLAATAYEAIRDYVFAVIPLFMLMGEFIGKSGTVTDVYRGINRLLKRIPGRLAIATVLGNALFSFVTGVSIASAAAFSRIAYPEMKRFNYDKGFALGAIAGSSCLGMLIPPSVLMIVWGYFNRAIYWPNFCCWCYTRSHACIDVRDICLYSGSHESKSCRRWCGCTGCRGS